MMIVAIRVGMCILSSLRSEPARNKCWESDCYVRDSRVRAVFPVRTFLAMREAAGAQNALFGRPELIERCVCAVKRRNIYMTRRVLAASDHERGRGAE